MFICTNNISWANHKILDFSLIEHFFVNLNYMFISTNIDFTRTFGFSSTLLQTVFREGSSICNCQFLLNTGLI